MSRIGRFLLEALVPYPSGPELSLTGWASDRPDEPPLCVTCDRVVVRSALLAGAPLRVALECRRCAGVEIVPRVGEGGM